LSKGATEVEALNSAFSGKVVLVTGASSGLGALTAAAFATRGAQVATNYPSTDAASHKAAIEQWLTEAGLDPDKVVPLEADVSDAGSVDAMYAEVKRRWGKLDILVNNAGINRDSTVAKMDDAQWRDVLAVNLDGAFYNWTGRPNHPRTSPSIGQGSSLPVTRADNCIFGEDPLSRIKFCWMV